MRSTSRLADVSINTLSKLPVDAGGVCAEFNDEIEVGHDRPVYWSTLELQAWDVLKPGLLELLDDPVFVARLARYFAQLHELASMVARRALWNPGIRGFSDIKDKILKLGPQLRHDGRIILDKLRRLG
jgi:hypothetical protein